MSLLWQRECPMGGRYTPDRARALRAAALAWAVSTVRPVMSDRTAVSGCPNSPITVSTTNARPPGQVEHLAPQPGTGGHQLEDELSVRAADVHHGGHARDVERGHRHYKT
jgi:hypothetical protein